MAGRVVLITGANRGIGYSIAQSLGTASSDVYLLLGSRTKSDAEDAIQKLRTEASITVKMHALQLDVTNEESITNARQWIEGTFGRLDVLVNNAGIATPPDASTWSTYKSAFQNIFEVNITAVGWMCEVFTPLLRQSSSPKVINISSGRASMSRSSNKQLPPTKIVPYSVSKVALNALTLEFMKSEQAMAENAIEYFVANPGHCKTAFNGYKGIKDPLDGAKVVTELALAASGRFEPGFWEFEQAGMAQVPW